MLRSTAVENLKEAVEDLSDEKTREYIKKNDLMEESFADAKDLIQHELLEDIERAEENSDLETLYYDILDEEVEIEDE